MEGNLRSFFFEKIKESAKMQELEIDLATNDYLAQLMSSQEYGFDIFKPEDVANASKTCI